MSECITSPQDCLAIDPRAPAREIWRSLDLIVRQWRYLLASLLLVSLLAYVALAVAQGSGAQGRALNADYAGLGSASAPSLSGDDLYDLAAGGNPARSVLAAPRTFSGDDAYDRAAGSHPALFVRSTSGSYSGDDAYDPAAGGSP
jgi:hypothetical protein